MNMNTKSRATKSDVRELRDVVKEGADQARDNYEKVAATANDGADLFKKKSSTAIRGVLDYNEKLLEFAHANSQAAVDFFRLLSGVKSPSEFIELSTQHA